MTDGRAAAPRLEERLDRLEALVAALEAEDLELDEALRLFEEGVAHVRAARDLLRNAELKVEELADADAGAPDTDSGTGEPAAGDERAADTRAGDGERAGP